MSISFFIVSFCRLFLFFFFLWHFMREAGLGQEGTGLFARPTPSLLSFPSLPPVWERLPHAPSQHGDALPPPSATTPPTYTYSFYTHVLLLDMVGWWMVVDIASGLATSTPSPPLSLLILQIHHSSSTGTFKF